MAPSLLPSSVDFRLWIQPVRYPRPAASCLVDSGLDSAAVVPKSPTPKRQRHFTGSDPDAEILRVIPPISQAIPLIVPQRIRVYNWP